MQQGNQPHKLDGVATNENPNIHLQRQVSSQAGSSHARIKSMVQRARIANVPLPEAALKCPRCDSTYTKFCYFNNYSLTQPRHFCKSCRRYWTRGGALRNVPVGGGFRRNNKRRKSSGGRSKSVVVVSADNNATSLFTSHSSYSNPNKFLSYGQIQGFTSNLPIFSPLQSLGDYRVSNTGLDFGGIQMSSNSGILDQWRTSSSQQAQQFPFLINNRELEQSSNVLYLLLQEGTNQFDTQLRSKPLMELASGSDGVSHTIDVQAEESYMGNINRNSMRDNEYTS